MSHRSRACTSALALPLVFCIAIVAGCSKPGPAGPGPGAPPVAVGSGDGTEGATTNACAKDITAGDVADLLGTTGVTEKQVATNAEACEFNGPGVTSVVIGLRAGDEVDPFWKMTLSLNHDAMVPLPGVGDQAMRMPDGASVMARKGALGCQVDVIGIDAILARPAIGGSKDALAQRLGAICAKIFAARHA